MKKYFRSITIASLFSCAILSTTSFGQENVPVDFSGLYMPTSDFSRMIMAPFQMPYTDMAQALVDDFNSQYSEIEDQPSSFCVGPGMPVSMAMPAPFPLEIIQRPQDITIFFEAYFQYRKIYLEGYSRPDPVLPSSMGYSVGHWEGDTLVVNTTYLNESTMGPLHSGDGEIIERMRIEVGDDGIKRFIDEIVQTDSKIYTEDIVMRGVWDNSPDTPIMEYVCSSTMYEQHLERVRASK